MSSRDEQKQLPFHSWKRKKFPDVGIADVAGFLSNHLTTRPMVENRRVTLLFKAMVFLDNSEYSIHLGIWGVLNDCASCVSISSGKHLVLVGGGWLTWPDLTRHSPKIWLLFLNKINAKLKIMTTRYPIKGYINLQKPRLTFGNVSTNDERQTVLLDMTNVLAASVAIVLSFIALIKTRSGSGWGEIRPPLLFVANISRRIHSIKGNCSPSQHVILPEIAVL